MCTLSSLAHVVFATICQSWLHTFSSLADTSAIVDHGPHLWLRDFKQANECFYSSADPLLPTTAVINREYLNSAATTRFYYLKLVGTIKVYTQIYFFILMQHPMQHPKNGENKRVRTCERTPCFAKNPSPVVQKTKG